MDGPKVDTQTKFIRKWKRIARENTERGNRESLKQGGKRIVEMIWSDSAMETEGGKRFKKKIWLVFSPPRSMKVLSWNYHGLGNTRAVRALRKLVQQ